MNCERVQEFLSDYLEDLLPAEEREAVESHLRSCPECDGAREGLARL